ncbi:MAG: fumarate hydratase C-terminal domain-containing protein [Actinobacteria bacterium]|nr:fumarate hydratase C-terminal domain-containing protein [Actinomycetota bacterium]
MARVLRLPLSREDVQDLKVGEEVLLSGPALTMRDASLKRYETILNEGKQLPVDLKGELIFHAGPTPAARGRPCGSIGPTTTARMDRFLSWMLESGVVAVLGKGPRGTGHAGLHGRHGAVYFAAVGGLGALYAGMVEEIELMAWEDLGPEAIYRVELKDFPAIVAIDSRGEDMYVSLYTDYRKRG